MTIDALKTNGLADNVDLRAEYDSIACQWPAAVEHLCNHVGPPRGGRSKCDVDTGPRLGSRANRQIDTEVRAVSDGLTTGRTGNPD